LIVIKVKETKMRQSLLLIAVLGTLATSTLAFAEEAAKEEKSNWNLTTNFGVVSDYYARGVSQTWHKPTVQGGIDVTHSSGFYAGLFGSGVTPNTYPDANTEIDVYAGYNGEIKAVKGLGYTAGLIGYLYPGGSWDKYKLACCEVGTAQTPQGGRWNTYEANFGLSYEWISAKASMTLGDWYGAERKTGWDGGTNGTTYLEINAAYPLPWWDLTLIGHVGRLNVAGKLNYSADFTSVGGGSGPSTSISGETNPDYTDYKIGLSKAFKVANSDGWNAGIYYTGNNNKDYWGKRGYGGTSFNGSSETKNLGDDRFVFTLSRSF
jgi:uncharacterized protein (TIGR02001 family)